MRDFFYERHKYMAVLDERAEQLFERLHRDHGIAAAGAGGASGAESAGSNLVDALKAYLLTTHGVSTTNAPSAGLATGSDGGDVVRAYEPSTRALSVSAYIRRGRQHFQAAVGVGLSFLANRRHLPAVECL